MSLSWIMTLTFVGLFVMIVVRRVRRSFGRQPFRPRGLVFVVALMSTIATVMLLVPSTPASFKLAGAGLGAALALWALALTRFGVDGEGRFYVPNGTIGLIVLTLFFARVIMRLWGVSGIVDRMEGAAAAGQPPGLGSSPGTMLALFLLLGYYVVYYGGVLVRGTRLTAPNN